MTIEDDENEARRIARHFTPEAVETLVDIIKDRKNAAATRYQAANAIIQISGINQPTAMASVTASVGG